MYIDKKAKEVTIHTYDLRELSESQMHVILMSLERYESDIRWDMNENKTVVDGLIETVSEAFRG